MGGWWFPPQYLEAMGIDPEDWAGYTPANYVTTRWCHECDCSQKANDDEACWQCGAATSRDKPKYWPNGGSNEAVTGGASFGAWELAYSEEVVAALLEGVQTGGMGHDALIPESVLEGAS